MWEPVPLPYLRDSNHILPTTTDIRACSSVLLERLVTKVVAIDGIIVKFGGGVNVREGQALLYLERHIPDVPAPRLHAMYYDSDELFLLMERAPGVQLKALWPTLTEAEKEGITVRLRAIFQSLRQAKCPSPGFFGGLDGGGVYHHLLYSQKPGDHKFLGPFYDEKAFVAGLTSNFRALIERNGRPDFKARHYEAHLDEVLGSFQSTFTHGDLDKTNIILDEIPDNAEQRSFNVMLIDWEQSGWYPDFWEFFCASARFDLVYWEEDWCWRVEQFLPVWAAKTAMMRMLDKDMRT